jgi:hypothetical protein
VFIVMCLVVVRVCFLQAQLMTFRRNISRSA